MKARPLSSWRAGRFCPRPGGGDRGGGGGGHSAAHAAPFFSSFSLTSPSGPAQNELAVGGTARTPPAATTSSFLHLAGSRSAVLRGIFLPVGSSADEPHSVHH